MASQSPQVRRRSLAVPAALALCTLVALRPVPSHPVAPAPPPPARARPGPSPAQTCSLEFIDTSFENASPLWYEVGDDGVVFVHLLYDHERASPNRAAGHFHFQLQARAGSKLTLEFRDLENVWNGRKASLAPELKAAVVSQDGRRWRSVPLRELPGGQCGRDLLHGMGRPGPARLAGGTGRGLAGGTGRGLTGRLRSRPARC